jgi:hypothetical protein
VIALQREAVVVGQEWPGGYEAVTVCNGRQRMKTGRTKELKQTLEHSDSASRLATPRVHTHTL